MSTVRNESKPQTPTRPQRPRQFEPDKARKVDHTTRTLLLWALIAIGVAMLHEAGHHLAASLFGSHLEYARVFPGLQIYPQLRWSGWDARLMYTAYSGVPGIPSGWRDGAFALMGSGSTALAAYAALALLLVAAKRKRWARTLAAVAFLGAADVLCYSLLPILGIRNGFPFAGEDAEPYRGAWEIGVPPIAYWSLLAIHTLVCYGLLAWAWWRVRTASRTRL